MSTRNLKQHPWLHPQIRQKISGRKIQDNLKKSLIDIPTILIHYGVRNEGK